MKKIIVPVDFSTASYDAYLFARQMAAVLNTSLEVLHVYNGGFSINEPTYIKPTQEFHDAVMERLHQFVKLSSPQDGSDVMIQLKIETKAIEGPVISHLIDQSKAADTVMIIMGTTGAHDMLERWLGSISSEVAQLAQCPVLLVPKESSFTNFEEILYASNFESADEDVLEQIIEFAKLFKSSVHFIHVEEKESTEDFSKTEDRIFNLLFEDGDPTFSFNLASIKSKSIMKGLEQYAEENNIDLIVLVNRQRSFVQNLLKQSLTKKLALFCKTPMLVFHL